MKKTIITLSTALCLMFVIHSCKKNGSSQSQSNKNSTTNELAVPPPPGYSTIHDYRTEIRKIVGQALAKAIVNIDVKNFIKSQTIIQLKGETEFLYAQKYNTIVTAGKTLAQVLDDNSPENLNYFTNDVTYYDPYLTILIPDDYEPENWNTSGFTPKVVPSPSGWNDEDQINAPLYDATGQIGMVSSEEQPEELTVVVGECESLTAFLKPYSAPNGIIYFENETYKYFENEGMITLEAGEEFVPKNNNFERMPNSRGCDRDNNNSKLDMMGNLNINGKTALKSMESWIKGRAELLYRVVYNEGTPTNYKIVDVEKIIPVISRKKAKNAVSIPVNITHMIWGNVLQMDRYFIKFAEREGNGGSVTPRTTQLILAINKATITLNQPINWRRKDRECGQQEIQYCTQAFGSGTTFNTGLVTFNIRF